MNALLIDFGSTFTKLRAVALDPPRELASGQGPSTVASDITAGMQLALADLERRMGRLPDFTHRLACSSAAGGLRMVTVGLVRELTAEAARQAALGAGAKLAGTFAQRLTRGDVAAIDDLAPDLVLLAGGTDGGNTEVIVHNAEALAAGATRCPVVIAGNRAAADAVGERLAGAGWPVTVTGNVMPELGTLDIEPARAAIRQVFIDRIVHAKGIDRARALFDRVLMPTPAAVMEGARLIADGAGAERGLGEVLVVDVGGATTDVHSVAQGAPCGDGAVVRGLPEPRLKRTVEGDLGMRHNARAILEAAGLDAVAQDAGLPAERTDALVTGLAADVGRLPTDRREEALDIALARAAVRLAVRRHAGTVEIVYTATGPVRVQRGKDLSAVAAVIGTGGVLAHGTDPAGVLSSALADPADPLSLRPRDPRLLLDAAYLLYAVGLLGTVAPEAAVRLGRDALAPVRARTMGERHVTSR